MFIPEALGFVLTSLGTQQFVVNNHVRNITTVGSGGSDVSRGHKTEPEVMVKRDVTYRCDVTYIFT